jgi:hypothetical protein
MDTHDQGRLTMKHQKGEITIMAIVTILALVLIGSMAIEPQPDKEHESELESQ